MSREFLHKNFCTLNPQIHQWFADHFASLSYPIYSSYDIRDSGFKVSNVDANIYPAGFNNICPTDKETSTEIMANFLDVHYGKNFNKILLVTEEHTKNPFYWENISTIKHLIESSGRKVLVSIPQKLESPITVESSKGEQIQVVSAFQTGKEVSEFKPDLIVSNNDFSEAYEEWAAQTDLPMNPPREMGWYQRKKSRYFKHYNQLVEDFAKVAGFDPFLMNVKTEIFEDFDAADENSKKALAAKVDEMIAHLKEDYAKRGIQEEPFVFVKNNAGTYGLAVIRVASGQDVMSWTYKSKKKMKAAKGGRDVDEVIIQEGISSRVQVDGAAAEPVIYMIGCQLAGGFLRTHAEKGSTDSLNSPGAVYKRLCTSDLMVSLEKSPLENVYGTSAKLGLLAIAREAEEMQVQFKAFQKISCKSNGQI